MNLIKLQNKEKCHCIYCTLEPWCSERCRSYSKHHKVRQVPKFNEKWILSLIRAHRSPLRNGHTVGPPSTLNGETDGEDGRAKAVGSSPWRLRPVGIFLFDFWVFWSWRSDSWPHAWQVDSCAAELNPWPRLRVFISWAKVWLCRMRACLGAVTAWLGVLLLVPSWIILSLHVVKVLTLLC